MNGYADTAREWLSTRTFGHPLPDEMVESLAHLIRTEVDKALAHAAESAWQMENRREFP